MSSTTTLYRKEHPEWREQEILKDRARSNILYEDNPEYREKVNQRALARYFQTKRTKIKCYPNFLIFIIPFVKKII
jgi:hypothetical protein